MLGVCVRRCRCYEIFAKSRKARVVSHLKSRERPAAGGPPRRVAAAPRPPRAHRDRRRARADTRSPDARARGAHPRREARCQPGIRVYTSAAPDRGAARPTPRARARSLRVYTPLESRRPPAALTLRSSQTAARSRAASRSCTQAHQPCAVPGRLRERLGEPEHCGTRGAPRPPAHPPAAPAVAHGACALGRVARPPRQVTPRQATSRQASQEASGRRPSRMADMRVPSK